MKHLIINIAVISIMSSMVFAEENHKFEPSTPFAELAVKLEAEMHAKYFQEFSDFLNSEEFDKRLSVEERRAVENGANPKFYMAGFIRGVMIYSDTNVLLRGDGHAKRPANSRWKAKNDEYSGFLEGSKFGKKHGTDLFKRLLSEIQTKLKDSADSESHRQ